MNTPLHSFFTELTRFSRKNWWVYLVFAVALAIIFQTGKGNTLAIATAFCVHFTADILSMMMISEYAQGSGRRAAYYQITATGLFLGLTTYTATQENNWQYLAADLIYILAGIKNYWKDVKHVEIQWITPKSLTLLSLFIVGGIYLPYGLIQESPQWVQMVGIFLFAIALGTTGNEKARYVLSLVGLIGMVGGSAWELTRTFIVGDIKGLALSYFLLPATVLIVYLKLWRSFFPFRQQ